MASLVQRPGFAGATGSGRLLGGERDGVPGSCSEHPSGLSPRGVSNVWQPYALAGNQEPTHEGSEGTTSTPGNKGSPLSTPQNDQILLTQEPLADGNEMINDLMNYLLRAGSIGWELIAVAPVGDGMRLFFKKLRTDEA